jgi:hypothetical protein
MNPSQAQTAYRGSKPLSVFVSGAFDQFAIGSQQP